MFLLTKINTKEKQELKINDVVLTQDDKITPRNNWRREKVEELIASRDSKISGAVLSVYNKKKESTFLPSWHSDVVTTLWHGRK